MSRSAVSVEHLAILAYFEVVRCPRKSPSSRPPRLLVYGAQMQGENRGYDEVVATINAGLELRRWCRRVTPQQRARLNQLIGLVPG